MILSDRDIKKALQEGRIKIDPPPDLETQLGPCSIDLRLGNSFGIFQKTKFPVIDLNGQVSIDDIMTITEMDESESFIMHPGEFVLATTMEVLELADDIVGRLEGRSSLGRLGIIVHSTAAVFHPGWRGKATMELGNLGRMPVALNPGIRICAFTFEPLSSPAERPYGNRVTNKYQGQMKPVASKIMEEMKQTRLVRK